MKKSVKLLDQAIEIGIAETSKEKRDIYRLRYRVYIEEMAFPITSADHKNKLLHDELDEWGTLLYAKVGTKIIGTLRINIGLAKDFPSELVTSFCLDRFGKYLKDNQKIAYASNGMISLPYRGSGAHNLLEIKSYDVYCDEQVKFSFGNCQLYLLPFHEHYGYRRFGRSFVNPDFGVEACFVMVVDDINHLRKVNSPLFNIAKKRNILSTELTGYFYSEFPEAEKSINSRIVTEKQLWSILSDRLGDTPNKAIALLHELSEAEAKKLLHYSGVIIRCQANSYIVNGGNESRELNILLSGRLHFSDSGDVTNIKPGQQFGVVGLVYPTKHLSNIVAATDAEILVLSSHYFERFCKYYPDIANKILRNLLKVSLNNMQISYR